MSSMHSLRWAICAGLLATMVAVPTVRRATAAPDDTPICGVISASATWTPAGSPYTLCSGVGATVAAGATLTIAPGVVVQGGSFSGLQVDGSLIAHGTPGSPITFTGVAKTPGAWSGIGVGSASAISAAISLRHAVIEYGGGSGGDALRLFRASAQVSDTTVRFSGKHGVNVGAGSHFDASALTLLNNGVAAQGYPILFGNLDVEPIGLREATVGGNGIDAIALQGGTLSGNQRWPAFAVPYQVLGMVAVPAGAALKIDPGVRMRFDAYAGLSVFGRLDAAGLPAQPITFTGIATAPGAWRGITIQGAPGQEASAVLDQSLVEHGGAFTANVQVLYGRIIVENSVIRRSANHGVQVGYQSAATIRNSRIVDHAGYGVYADSSADTVIAADNWWGAASGPNADNNCNPGGAGARISSEVIFQPFQQAPGQPPDLLGAADAPQLALSPAKWFAPADPARPISLSVRLRDGQGRPMANQPLQYRSNLGLVEGGQTTNAAGQATAYFVPLFPGDADVAVSLQRGACQSARSAQTRITLSTPPTATVPGLVDSALPYASGNVIISPLPIVAGVTTTVRISIVNPLTTTIYLTGAFGVVDSGVGLPFDVIALIGNAPIPPGAVREFSARWVPARGGHTCVQFAFGYRRAGQPGCTTGCGPGLPGGSGGPGGAIGSGYHPGQWGIQQHNVQVTTGAMKTQPTTTFLDTLKYFIEAFGTLAFILEASGGAAIVVLLFKDQISGNILDFAFGAMNPLWCRMFGGVNCQGWKGPSFQYPGKFIGDLYSDPPRQDYTVPAGVDVMSFTPAVASASVPQTRADAANRLLRAQLNMTAHVVAAVVSFDRAAGAAEAGDTFYNGLQIGAYLHYIRKSAEGMQETADALDAMASELNAEGFATLTLSRSAFDSYRQRLQTQGFTAAEREAARQTGFYDEGLDQLRAYRLSLPYERIDGDIISQMRSLAGAYRALAAELLSWPAYGDSAAPGLLHRSSAAASNLARINRVESQFKIGNPYTRTATIALEVRRLEVPSDWLVHLSPLTVTLAPGAWTTGTVSLIPGAPAVQGTTARVGVEGYVNDALVGGVSVNVVVPRRELFNAVKTYLPVARWR